MSLDLNPKQKAVELYTKHYDLIAHDGAYWDIGEDAKQCALTSINEIVDVLFSLPRIPYTIEKTNFYRKVKQEIERL